jgi:hypothetical protein
MCGGGGGGGASAPPPPRRGSAAANMTTANTMPVQIGGQEFRAPRRDADIPGITEMAYGLIGADIALPDQQLAGFTPSQQAAFGLAQQGVGSYIPFLQAATGATGAGLSGLAGASAGTQQLGAQIPGQVQPGQAQAFQSAQDARMASMMGIGGLAGTGGFYDPSMVQPFMNQFEDAAVQRALSDIQRQGDIAGQGLRAQAVGSGAFGGSRQAVAEQELQRNIMEQQGRTAAGMRQAGFESAAQRSQAAFEQALARQQQASTGIGSLGIQGAQAAGNLGMQGSQLGLAGLQAGLGAQQQRAGIAQAAGAMGQQFAGLGAQQQQQQMADIGMLGDVGRQQQQQAQAGLDVNYANQYQRAMMPFQQLAFASDIITGAPSGQSAITTRPGPSVGSQVLGGGLALSQLASAFGGN